MTFLNAFSLFWIIARLSIAGLNLDEKQQNLKRKLCKTITKWVMHVPILQIWKSRLYKNLKPFVCLMSKYMAEFQESFKY